MEEKNEQLKVLSSRDGLTGLYNRRFFDIFIEEEFIALLPDTDLKGAESLAGDLIQSIHNQKIPHEGLNTGKYLTISLGVCCAYPDKTLNARDFLKCVDKALYTAKDNGRDQWVSGKYTG